MIVSMDKEYRTEFGWIVSNLTQSGGDTWIGFAELDDDIKYACEWSEDGKCRGVATLPKANLKNFTLIEVKPRIKRTVWLNVYRCGDAMVSAHDTLERAKGWSRHEIVARVPVEIDCEEGEGL